MAMTKFKCSSLPSGPAQNTGSSPSHEENSGKEELISQMADNEIILAEIEGLLQRLVASQLLRGLDPRAHNDSREARTTIQQLAGAQAGGVQRRMILLQAAKQLAQHKQLGQDVAASNDIVDAKVMELKALVVYDHTIRNLARLHWA